MSLPVIPSVPTALSASSPPSPVPSSALPAPWSGADCGDLDEVATRLRLRGHDVELVRIAVCGDVDVRLLAGALGGPAVELMGPCGDELPGERWHAVRVTAGRRVVWCGPLRSCAPGEVVRFVEDLLRRGVRDLIGGYSRLG